MTAPPTSHNTTSRPTLSLVVPAARRGFLVGLALGGLLAGGCQGLPPAAGVALREAQAAADRYRESYQSVARSYLADLATLLDAQAAAAGRAALTRLAQGEGGLTLAEALGVLDQDRAARAKIRARLAALRDRLTENEQNARIWAALSRDVLEVLRRLERRREADDALRDRAAEAAAAAAKAAAASGGL